MNFDLYADLADQQACPSTPSAKTVAAGLASGFVDGCTARFAKGELASDKKLGTSMKNDARNCYIERVKAANLSTSDVHELLEAVPRVLQAGWLLVEVSFILQTPWYSKDDRPFHVLDNPLRKDRIFGVPYMSAASWKGLLRWSFGMTTGLIGPSPLSDEKKRRAAEAAIVHLFGNEKGATDNFQRGSLAFYPTWFSRIGFEVINPHSRKTRAGTQPIYYEVVPPKCKGTLRLLYAPLPGQAAREGVDAGAALGKLLEAVEKLLTVYGFSAKRTSGWGRATVDDGWSVQGLGEPERGSREEVTAKLGHLLGVPEAKP